MSLFMLNHYNLGAVLIFKQCNFNFYPDTHIVVAHINSYEMIVLLSSEIRLMYMVSIASRSLTL